MSIEKLDLQSPDLVDDNFQKLAELFPNCVTESAEGRAIDFDLLKQEINHAVVEGTKERYRLEWPGKRQAIVTANIPTNKTLRPIREESVNFDSTENVYIEGDNLDVLKLLQESYLGKIKMIYIDPPYNTGKDFVYNDNFTTDKAQELFESGQTDELKNRLVANPESGGRYHSDWLSMMYPRLKLARNLLREDGVIFISIDDNEVHNLRKVCDEIFGEKNFIGKLVVQTATDNNPTQINTEHEYMICYSKQKDSLQNWTATSAAAELLNKEFMRLKGIYTEDNENIQKELRAWIKKNKEDLPKVTHYDNVDQKGVFHDGDVANTVFGGYKYEVLHPKTLKACKIPDKGFRFPQTTMMKMIASDDVVFGDDENTLIKPKKRLEDVTDMLRTVIYEDGRTSTKVVDSLIGKSVFDNPKSHFILKRIIDFCSNCSNKNSDEIILDFYSGSATTAHAVTLLNSEDKGCRKYIMVQIPEPTEKKSEAHKAGYSNICEIGKERIRRAGKAIKTELKEKITAKKAQLEKSKEGLKMPDDEKIKALEAEIAQLESTLTNLDTGFRVYRLDESNMREVYYRPQDLKQEDFMFLADNVKEGRSSDDLLAQVLLDWGLPLSISMEKATIAGKQVYKVGGNSLYACFESGIDEAFAKAIAPDAPLRVVFKDKSFADDTAKINVQQLLRQLSPDTQMKVI
jgi:adenine-specific DNA-methyltransferase